MSIFDRGFLYGDGLFETLKYHNGNLFQWDRHWTRLKAGCVGLGIPLDHSSPFLKDAILELARKNHLDQAMVRIHVSRGTGNRGYAPPIKTQATWIVSMHKAPELPMHQPRSWNLIVSRLRSPSAWPGSTWKTTNKLFQILVKQEARDAHADDAIILNELGHVTEISCANVFFVIKNRIVTPPVDSGLLPGTTRNLFMDLAGQMGVPCQERTCDLETLKMSDSAFASLSSFGLVHIHRIQDTTYNLHPMEERLYQCYLKQLISAGQGTSSTAEIPGSMV